MFTIKIDETTLPMITEIGNRIAEDVSKLENLIWLVKAASVKQLAQAAKAYADAYDNNSTTPELAEALRVAAERNTTLEKFWSQEVGMRNRAVQFGQLEERGVPGWKALEAVMKVVLETTGSESTDTLGSTVTGSKSK